MKVVYLTEGGFFFLRALMFDIFVDWPKMQKFVPASIYNYLHYRATLGIVDRLPFLHINHKT